MRGVLKRIFLSELHCIASCVSIYIAEFYEKLEAFARYRNLHSSGVSAFGLPVCETV